MNMDKITMMAAEAVDEMVGVTVAEALTDYKNEVFHFVCAAMAEEAADRKLATS